MSRTNSSNIATLPPLQDALANPLARRANEVGHRLAFPRIRCWTFADLSEQANTDSGGELSRFQRVFEFEIALKSVT